MSHGVLLQFSDSDRKRRRCEQNHGGYIPFHERTGVTQHHTTPSCICRMLWSYAHLSPCLKQQQLQLHQQQQQQHSVAILAQVVDIRRRISAAWVVSLKATCSRHDFSQGSCQELVESDMMKVVLVFGAVSIAWFS